MPRRTPWIQSADLTPLSESPPSSMAGYRSSFDSLHALPRRSLTQPLWTGLSPNTQESPSQYCQKHVKSVGPHRHHAPDFHVFSGPIRVGGPRTQTAPSMSTVPTHPRDFPHMLAPFFNTFPRLPHTVTKLQKSRHWFRQDQRSGPANLQPAGPTNPQNLRIQFPQISNQPARKFPNPRLHLHGHGSLIRKPTRRDQCGRLTRIHASDQLTQIPCAGEGDMGTASLRDATTASASQWGPAFKPAWRRVTARRDLRVFTRADRILASGLRWRFRVFLLPAAQGGSVGIRIAYSACFKTLPHVLTYTAQYWVVFINMFHTAHPICGMGQCNGPVFATCGTYRQASLKMQEFLKM